MPLFQQSVIKKHIESFNAQHIEEKWQLFKAIFHSAEKQQNIRKSKEEQYQEGFLRDLFVGVFGYIINPEPNFNLLTEQKNVNNSKKADGAIVIDGKAVAVIELKGTETTDLNKIEAQAFGYKSNQPGCNYVIVSNFEKLRFYIDNTTQQEEFNLFTLTKPQFEVLYVCISWESISKNTPMQILNESVSKESVITNKLYKDYSEFKRALFANLVELNPQFDKLLLFKKTQKLLDRFLFVFFAEDRLLLPTNLIFRINKEWENIIAQRIQVSLYDRYKMYFNDLNVGAKVTLPAFGKKTGEAITAEFQIFAYNGGLFQPDEVLDQVKVDDSVLFTYTERLSHYNFESDVDVNILGHIFENSLNEIDEIKSELEGNTLDKTKTRRKKDGVFYTPKYITKYIVENTVGKLCSEKKVELKLNDEDYITDKKLQTKTKKALLDKLADYRNWLLDLTICDPACGSGAFLNQALEFLIAEHRYIDELQAKLLGESMVLSDIENSILERNIYGVDLNDESVEIAKLSLWLRTAQKGRKLNSLNNNIKCGNSLIDDPAVVGDKAFKWEEEFPEVFKKGGFDVVIGNPPYVFGGNKGISDLEKHYFKINYITGNGKVNLFTLFIEKSKNILKNNGEFSFIIPNTFLRVTSYHDSRRYFIENFNFRELADIGNDVFAGAVTSAIILLASKSDITESSKLKVIKDFSGKFSLVALKDIVKNNYLITSNLDNESSEILNKINLGSQLLGDECKEMIFGVVITKNKDEVVSDIKKDGYKPFLEGKDISAYYIKPIHQYLNYSKELLHRARSKEVFEAKEKLLVQRITGGKKPLKVAYDNKMYFNKESINNIILHDDSKLKSKYLLCILNSSLINWYYNNQFTNGSTLTVNISKEYLSRLPIKTDINQDEFILKADVMLERNEVFHELIDKFNNYLQSNFQLEVISTKIQHFYDLNFSDFIKELNKAIKTAGGASLTKLQEMEWMEVFETKKKEALELKAEIDRTDREIDLMVYELYGLSEEEIKIVEGS